MLSPGARFAGYQVERLIARGGMGEVYLARHEVLRRLDAVKLLRSEFADDPTFRERFLREAHLAARVRHPAIVTVYTAGEVAGRMFIASEYIVGGDLRQRMTAGRLPVEAAMRVVMSVADALDAAHASDLVHRDVKPENVLVQTPDGQPWNVYLTDFGITRLQKATTTLTEANSLIGTVGYIAPEQILGSRVDGRADQYSLGCLAFECLTGVLPFGDLMQPAMLKAHLEVVPPAVSSRAHRIPRGADPVLARALAKDPADRYETCREFAVALSAALDEQLPASSIHSGDVTTILPSPTPVRDLAVVAGPCSGLRIPLTAKRYVVGRSDAADAQVPDRFLSRRHFVLEVNAAGQVRLQDEGSVNGTLVEGEAVRIPRVLDGGEWIGAGASQMTIVGHRPLTLGRTGDDGSSVTIVRAQRSILQQITSSGRRFRRPAEPPLADDVHRLRAASPDATQIWVRAVDRTSQLWERCSADADALRMRVGTLSEPAGKRRKTAAAMPASPLTVDLLGGEPIVLSGDPALCDALIRWLIGQSACLLAPDELELVVALPSDDPLTWSWLSLLPHTKGRGTHPTWSADLPGSRRLISELVAEVDRATVSLRPFPLRRLVIADARTTAGGLDPFRSLTGRNVGVAAILVDRSDEASGADLTAGARGLHLDGSNAQLTLTGHPSVATPDGVSAAWAREIALALSRLTPAPRQGDVVEGPTG
ncbi:MAG TPA: protein kinase [Frankiaceae bacterium]|nr:protein kinase [Frankiaceae bacterium]